MLRVPTVLRLPAAGVPGAGTLSDTVRGEPPARHREKGILQIAEPKKDLCKTSGKTSGGAGERGRCRCPGCCSPHLLPYSIAVLSGKTSGGAGEKGRCRCPGCIIARNKVDDFTQQMGRCRSVPTCVEKSRQGTMDDGSRGRPVGGRGPGTMLVA